MIQYKCRSCGGEIEIGSAGSLVCPFCGTKSFMTDADFRGNEEFRKKLLAYYKAEALNKENDYSADTLWNCTGNESYTMQNGSELSIEYMVKDENDGYICYVAYKTVIYVFDDKYNSDLFMKGLNSLVFPEADTKLHRCFPELKMEIPLEDGRFVLVFTRRPNFYPAKLFSPWPSGHLAWVISRMENFCCELNYSDIEHGDITPSSVWINPSTHEGILFGDWRKVRPLKNKEDLRSLRKTAIELAENTLNPKELYDFLNSEPSQDAFEDFQKWDTVIEKGFGGHKFEKM